MDDKYSISGIIKAPEVSLGGTTGGCASLPCLNSNISIENQEKLPSGPCELSTSHKKTSFILSSSVASLAERFGIEFLGFLTLTFADAVKEPHLASRRLNSLLSNVIKPRYREYIGVMERQKSGRIHYHMLVVLPWDIRSGCDFDEFENRVYKSASKNLRNEWAFWRKTAPKYRFGRTELMPIKTTTDAIAKYVGKYIAKHVENRQPVDKNARLVRYSRGARTGNTRFMFNSEGARLWRKKVAVFASFAAQILPHENIKDMDDLARALGPRWAYRNREFILSLPVDS